MVAIALGDLKERYMVLGRIASMAVDEELQEESRIRAKKQLELYDEIAETNQEEIRRVALAVLRAPATKEQSNAQVPQDFSGFRLGSTKKDTLAFIEEDTSAMSIKSTTADPILGSEKFVYEGNNRFTNAVRTSLTFWRSRLTEIEIEFREPYMTADSFFDVLWNKAADKFCGDESSPPVKEGDFSSKERYVWLFPAQMMISFRRTAPSADFARSVTTLAQYMRVSRDSKHKREWLEKRDGIMDSLQKSMITVNAMHVELQRAYREEQLKNKKQKIGEF